MQQCMSKYPTLYGTDKDDEREDEFAMLEQQADDSNKRDSDVSSKHSSQQPSS